MTTNANQTIDECERLRVNLEKLQNLIINKVKPEEESSQTVLKVPESVEGAEWQKEHLKRVES